MNYDASVRNLLALGRELASPQQARVQKFGLENITALASLLGEPQRARPCVHIAGTNGKGSTAAMLDSILRAAGISTGLYTSPHLVRINERIRVNGEDISEANFAESCTRVMAGVERGMASGALAAHPTYFECVTAMAFDCFAHAPIDFAVYEVGLGGRLDATNIVAPEVTVITQIDFDHESFLGNTIAEIAGEKAGIIKPGGVVVSSAEHPEARTVIARRCAEQGARLVETDNTFRVESESFSGGCVRASVIFTLNGRTLEIAPGLPGRFQLRNALAAAATAELLAERGFAISSQAIEEGIATARWPGRLERLRTRPDVYLDGAHNPAGARELLRFWQEGFRGRRIVLVYGAMRDKAVDEIAGLLFPYVDHVVLTEPHQPRAISASLLGELAGYHARSFEIIPRPEQALEKAIGGASPDDAIFATGSLYLVGDLRRHWFSTLAAHSVRDSLGDASPMHLT
jgi:dihydrofolate synthase/folylpolyglutamate synthase